MTFCAKTFLLASLFIFLTSCNEKLTSSVYQIQKGTDRWELTLVSDNTFSLKKISPNGALSVFLEGDVFKAPTGFTFLTPTKTASGVPHKTPLTLIEADSQIAVISSINDERLLTLVPKEDCPSTSASSKSNWIVLRGDELNANDASIPFFGQLTFNENFDYKITSTFTLAHNDSLAVPETSSGKGTCVNGVVSWGSQAYGTFSKNGLASITQGQIQLLSLPSIPINLANISGDYSGFVYRSARNEILPIHTSIDKLGYVNMTSFENDDNLKVDVEGNSVWAETRWAVVNNPQIGFITTPNFKLHSESLPSKIACQISAFTSGTAKRLITCTGNDPESVSQTMSIILMSK